MHALTFPQQSIFLDSLLRGATTKFNMGGAILISGPFDAGRFVESLECARRAHDVQRLRLHLDGETALQEFVPADSCRIPFELLDFSNLEDPLQAANDWVLADIRRPMRLDQFPLHSDVLFRLSDGLHLWYPKFHHIACDAYGHSLITGTVAEAYNDPSPGEPWRDFKRPSYVGFIQDDAAYRASSQFLVDQSFWRDRFPSMPEPLPFTTRKGELAGDVLRTERHVLAVARPVYNAVVGRAQQAGVTLFQLLLACLYGYLNRVTGRDDLVIGTPILNRSNHAFRRTAGMFMNMMPLRLRIDRNASVACLAAQIKAETRTCYRHQRFPLGEVLRHCRSLPGFCHGVFDVTMVYRKLDYGVTFNGSPMRVVTLDTAAREETLSLEVDEYNDVDGVNLFFNYNPQLICSAEAADTASAFEMLLADIARGNDRRVRDIQLQSAQSISTRQSAPAVALTVTAMMERHAAVTPHALAAVCGEERITYGQLDGAANNIAAYLTGPCGAAREQPVAVLCERGVAWIIALCGVLKAGCAYLPLDPELPPERLRYILQDSGCRLLLAGARCGAVTFEGLRSIPVAEASRCGESAPLRPAEPGSLAYIIYTSGTTGQPKGVLIEHRSLSNTVQELLQGWEVTARDRVLEFAGAMFDASLVDIFLALASGAPLVIASRDEILNPPRFLDLLQRESVTVATLPPAYLSALGPVDLPLRLLITAGEAANAADVARHLQGVTVVNAYGPTEAAVCASYLKLADSKFPGGRVPIGKAIGNTTILILDGELQPRPAGAVGEICIAGVGLARGYLNRPELTAARFVTNPLAHERLYRTGDVGRLLPDGNIEFLGRRDAQLKVRGYRVEPEEVESALKTHPAVKTAAIASDGNGGLAAWVVASAGFDVREVRRFLAARLPAYMTPSRWFLTPRLPLHPSGKVDRDALLRIPAEEFKTERDRAVPQKSIEKTLAGIWEEVLEVAPVGLDDDFFELGGHSLKAVRVLSRVQRSLRAAVELTSFFSNPTVRGLAAQVEKLAPVDELPIPRATAMDSYPLSNAQSRVWVLCQMEGGLAAYNMPVALDFQGELDEDRLERAFHVLIARHESLRTYFVKTDGMPLQRIVPGDVAFLLGCEDFRDVASAEDFARMRIQEEFARPFDLACPPLMRAAVFRVTEFRWLLSIVVHHIVADGWSLDVLLRELAAVYSDSQQLPAPRLQYRDYSQWMSARLDTGALHSSRAFWMEKLSGPLPLLNLPASRARPAALAFAGAIERVVLPRTARLNLPQFCSQRGVSPFMVLLAGVFGLLHRYSGDQDIIIGTPVANRQRMDLEDQIGLYLNTLPLRVRIEPAMTAAELLERVRTTLLDAQQHQSYPFDSLIQQLNVPRSPNRNPLFDVMAVMQDTVRPAFRAPGVVGKEYPIAAGVSVFDLTFHFTRCDGGVRLDLEYNTALFETVPRGEVVATPGPPAGSHRVRSRDQVE